MTANSKAYDYQKAIQIISNKTHLSEDIITEIISRNLSIEILSHINSKDELFAYILIFEEELKYEQSHYLLN